MGAAYVDGGIWTAGMAAGTTRMYLSGNNANVVAALFTDTVLDAIGDTQAEVDELRGIGVEDGLCRLYQGAFCAVAGGQRPGSQ